LGLLTALWIIVAGSRQERLLLQSFYRSTTQADSFHPDHSPLWGSRLLFSLLEHFANCD
jgi:hypothetical protein